MVSITVEERVKKTGEDAVRLLERIKHKETEKTEVKSTLLPSWLPVSKLRRVRRLARRMRRPATPEVRLDQLAAYVESCCEALQRRAHPLG